MVKPPKTMQPEGKDLTRFGRKSASAFKSDSFHNYMSRKIDLQRKQFGTVLPPPPSSSHSTAQNGSRQVPTHSAGMLLTDEESGKHQWNHVQRNHLQRDHQQAPAIHPSRSSRESFSASGRPSLLSEANTSVQCSPPPINNTNTDKIKCKKGGGSESKKDAKMKSKSRSKSKHRTKSKSRSKVKRSKDDKYSMASVIARLKKKHGDPGAQNRDVRKRRIAEVVSTAADGPDSKRHAKADSDKANSTTEAVIGPSSTHHISTVNHEDVGWKEDSNTNDEEQQHCHPRHGDRVDASRIDGAESSTATPTKSNRSICPDDLSHIHPQADQQEFLEGGDHRQQQQQRPHHHQEQRRQEENSTSPQKQLLPTTHNDSVFSDAAEHEHEQQQEPPKLTLKQLRRQRPDLFFAGIVIKVNGYTTPDNESLKRMIQKHGGDYETYETTRVTHLIAESLSKAKVDMYKRQRNPRPVCLPSWIVDSTQRKKLLPHHDYLLPSMKDQSHGRLVSFLKPRKLPAPAATNPPSATSQPSISPPLPSSSTLDGTTTTSTVTRKQRDTKSTAVDDHLHPKPSEARPSERRHASNPPPSSSSSSRPSSGNAMSTPEEAVATVAAVEAASPPIAVATVEEATATPQMKPLKEHTQSAEKRPHETSNTVQLTLPPKGGNGNDSALNHEHSRNNKRTVGTDPQFLESFFLSSRLSFIGSYKQRIANSIKPTVCHKKQASSQNQRHVLHVDMDCFFVNVALRNFPQHRDKPVAISHYGNTKDKLHSTGYVPVNSSSECATCNYHARKYGVKKGMFLGRAKQLCPDLIILDYDFKGYEEVSDKVLDILHLVAVEHRGSVEAVSCDEAYIEVYLDDTEDSDSNSLVSQIAERIRQEIADKTQCTASVGVASNKLLAKLGTDKVKPDGCFVVTNPRELLAKLRLRDLHGIGYRTEPKLKAQHLVSVQDVWDLGARGETVLCSILGAGLGKKIFNFCNGIDDRLVEPVKRKTIGAECNYGVRFDGPYGIDHFINGLAKEVEKRMTAVNVKGKRITVKVKQRKQGAKPPPKYLGHGSCHNLSKSGEVEGEPTWNGELIAKTAMSLFLEMKVNVDDVRGMGIIMSKLDDDSGATAGDGVTKTASKITNWFRNEDAQEEWQKEHMRQSAEAGKRKDPLIGTAESASGADSAFASGAVGAVHAHDANATGTNLNPGASINIGDKCSGDHSQQAEKGPFERRANVLIQTKSQDRQDEASFEYHSPPTQLDATSPFQYSQDRSTTDNHPPFQPADDASVIFTGTAHNVRSPIEMPSLSQLHMSQVDALPKDLRHQILRYVREQELKNMPKRGGSGNGDRLNVIDVDALRSPGPADDVATHAAVVDENSLKGNAVMMQNRNEGWQQHHEQQQQEEHRQQEENAARFRQTDLKRMMKLASVKAGEATINVSLTQLEHLPLEIKLQIVNDDDMSVGRSSQHMRRPKSTSKVRMSAPSMDPSSENRSNAAPRSSKTTVSATAAATLAATGSTDVADECSLCVDDTQDQSPPQGPREDSRFSSGPRNPAHSHAHNSSHRRVLQCEATDGLEIAADVPDVRLASIAPYNESKIDASRTFHETNVLPLQQYLDDHPATDADAQQMVISFLVTCMQERRATDTSRLLHCIRDRADGWGDETIMQNIIDSLNVVVVKVFGHRIDFGL